MTRLAAILLAILLALPAAAADKVGVAGERAVSISGTVVDLLCEVAHRCAPDCGGGTRQLGLRTQDGRLVPAVKSTTLFAGTTHDLLPYCGKAVIADGVLSTGSGNTIYMVQYLRLKPSAPWASTEAFLAAWAKARGVSVTGPIADQWFRHDPAIAAAVAKRGKLGVPPS